MTVDQATGVGSGCDEIDKCIYAHDCPFRNACLGGVGTAPSE